jgi:hypothetical protein
MSLLYIDPGSGSYLIQVIIAAVLGALFYIKNIWWKIKAFFTRNKSHKSQQNSVSDKNT